MIALSPVLIGCAMLVGASVVVFTWCCLVVAKNADQIMEDIERDDIERLRRMRGAA